MSTAAKHPLGGEHPFEHIDSTVYQLMHHGWRKGEEQFRNRIYFTVQAERRSEGTPSATEVAAFVIKALNNHDDLLEVLRSLTQEAFAAGLPMTSPAMTRALDLLNKATGAN